MTSSPPWPTNPHNPTAIRLYGVDITEVPPGEPNIEISFLQALRGQINLDEKERITGLKLQFTPEIPIDRQVSKRSNQTIAVIYSYAFEGHCYKLDKPKVMVFFSDKPAEAAVGCGFESAHELPDPKKRDRSKSAFDDPHDDQKPEKSEGVLPTDVKSLWRMWLVDRLDRVIELDVNQGFFEELILEANMPGKRSPTTYSANMQVAHRGGRLMD